MFQAALMFIVAAVLSKSATASSPCQTGNETMCLQRVRSLVVDKSAFWFGTPYWKKCPHGNDGTPGCLLIRPNATGSIMGRLTSEQSFDPNALRSIPKVVFHPNTTGITTTTSISYNVCGLTVNITRTPAESFTIDPLDNRVYRPHDLQEMPDVSWPARDGEMYTMVFYDVGFEYLHNLWINIKGQRPSGGEEVKSYTGPGNPYEMENIYVIAVFKQASVINRFSMQLYSLLHFQKFGDIAEKFHLTGPIAINFLRVPGDAIAAAKYRSGLLNYCPYYVAQDILNYMHDHGLVSFLPANLSLKASLDVLYNSPAITYRSCCKDYSVAGSIYRRDDISAPQIPDAVVVRNRPTVTVVPVGYVALPNHILEGKKYTLLVVEAVANKTNDVLIHWMVINIPDKNIAAGDEVLTYSSPHPEVHRESYMFLYYEQRNDLTVSETKRYAGTNCISAEVGRCHYRIEDFIRSNSLSLVGFREMLVNSDSYSRGLLYTTHLKTVKEACRDQHDQILCLTPVGGVGR